MDIPEDSATNASVSGIRVWCPEPLLAAAAARAAAAAADAGVCAASPELMHHLRTGLQEELGNPRGTINKQVGWCCCLQALCCLVEVCMLAGHFGSSCKDQLLRLKHILRTSTALQQLHPAAAAVCIALTREELSSVIKTHYVWLPAVRVV